MHKRVGNGIARRLVSYQLWLLLDCWYLFIRKYNRYLAFCKSMKPSFYPCAKIPMPVRQSFEHPFHLNSSSDFPETLTRILAFLCLWIDVDNSTSCCGAGVDHRTRMCARLNRDSVSPLRLTPWSGLGPRTLLLSGMEAIRVSHIRNTWEVCN